MRLPILSLLVLLLASCSANAYVVETQPYTLIGDSLPPIRHITEMKVAGDTLWFVYETEDGFGQRFLRRAVIDIENNTLDVGPDIGRKADRYFMAYMPYPVNGVDGKIQVVNQEDGEIFNFENDCVLTRTNTYILSGNSTLPFPISQYVQDVSSISDDNYIFIGRKPNGGEQYAMRVNITTSEIDTIRKIQPSPEVCSWIPNSGQLLYSTKHDRFAFVYLLLPIIEIFKMDGSRVARIKIGEDTFNKGTIDKADINTLNPIHHIDACQSADSMFTLYWGKFYDDAINSESSVIRVFDFKGNIINEFEVSETLYNIAVTSDGKNIIAFNGEGFVGMTVHR